MSDPQRYIWRAVFKCSAKRITARLRGHHWPYMHQGLAHNPKGASATVSRVQATPYVNPTYEPNLTVMPSVTSSRKIAT